MNNQPTFWIDGHQATLAEMLAVNQHDTDVTTWLQTAKVGAVYPSIHNPVVRIT